MNGTKRFAGKIGLTLCAALFGTLAGQATCAAEVSVAVDVVAIHTDNDFHEPLSPYGHWEVVGDDGSCWIPNGVAAEWSPYSNGYWQQTDAGWYWASDEPWAWATYHYGGWDYSPQFGWYWVPQTQWAPAWVSWREGGGCVGWAPLGPSGRAIVEINERNGRPRGYVFVQERQFLEPVSAKTIVVNNTIINKTVNITKTHTVNKMVINAGPTTTVIEKASGRTVSSVPVRELRTKEEAKVVAKRTASASEKAVQTPTRIQAEKPAMVPAVNKEALQTDEQNRIAKLDEEKRAQQEKALATKSAKKQPVLAAVEARPETNPEVKHEAKPDAKIESKPAAERPAAQERTEQKSDKDGEKKD